MKRKDRPLWQIVVDWIDDILGIGGSLPRRVSKKAIRESDEAAGVGEERW